MIEINLLPEEMRQAEGTPPARFAVVIAGVLLASGLGVWIGKYYLIDIPWMRSEIKNRDLEIQGLKQREQEVKDTDAKIATLKQKVQTLDNLIQSRIRYGRLLDYLCNAVPPDGVWFKSFSVQTDSTPLAPGAIPGAKRYMISLTGFTSAAGGTAPEQARKEEDDKLTLLMNNLRHWFQKVGVDPKTGINTFLGAKFGEPQLRQKNISSLPQPTERDPRILKLLAAPKEGLDFSMTLSFELPQKQMGP